MDIALVRTYYPTGTLSRIDFDGTFILYGVERTRTDSKHPCIPEGRYTLEPHTSTKFPAPIWAMVNESLGVYHEPQSFPSRFACLFGHVGNSPQDVEGCVALGEVQIKSPLMVGSSRLAVQAFQKYMSANWNPTIGLLITSEGG